ncbi:MAG: aconitate hydratase, partial [Actinomycetota bacterium]
MNTSSHSGSDPFGARTSIETKSGRLDYFRLSVLEEASEAKLEGIPITVKILLENLLRTSGTEHASVDEVNSLAVWGQKPIEDREFPFSPSRVILQDFTGVPAVVDLAAMRSAMER